MTKIFNKGSNFFRSENSQQKGITLSERERLRDMVNKCNLEIASQEGVEELISVIKKQYNEIDEEIRKNEISRSELEQLKNLTNKLKREEDALSKILKILETYDKKRKEREKLLADAQNTEQVNQTSQQVVEKLKSEGKKWSS